MTTRQRSSAGIPLRKLGRSDEMVSALALGGAHIGQMDNQRDAIKLIHAAIDAGITFLDNAAGCVNSRAMEDSSCTRRPRSSTGRPDGNSTGFPRRRSSKRDL